MKKHIVRLFVYLVIIALVLQTTPIQALPITDASIAPRQDLTAWQLEPKLPHEALSPGEDLRTPTAEGLAQPVKPETSFECSMVTDIPEMECEALVSLYFSTNGSGWAIRTNWLVETPAANWYGVTVSGGHVTALNLSSNLLSGSLPYWLIDLTKLEYLYLRNNQIGGTIQNLSGIVSLEALDLNNNLLTGSIPGDLNSIYFLKTLDLGHNQLTGSIPAGLGDLSSLTYLHLGSNQLTGSIPAELGNLSLLDYLNLGSNQLSGSLPARLGDLSVLDYLNLSSNPLSGMIPLNFSNLENLTTFYFIGTSLCEPDSTEFIAWKATVTTWSGTDVVCDAFCLAVTDVPYHECDALKALYGSTNGDEWTDKTNWLTSTTVGGWYGVTVAGGYVTGVDLYYNELSGNIPSDLGNLGNLGYLDLSWNQLSGSIPSELGKLSNLQYLNLSSNQLIGSIPTQLGSLGNLKQLYLHHNQLTGIIPSELGDMSSLLTLALFDNQLTGSIPSQLGNLSNLVYLHLDSNQLTGNIPSDLGNLGNLKNLTLEFNQLSGSIPPALGSLSKLTHLYLGSNQLTGVIPPELGNLSRLNFFRLSSNQLTGSIPTALGNLTDLAFLHLDSNQLDGTIPSVLGNLSNLQELRLSSNQLTGSIPSALGNLTRLYHVRLDQNKLSGDVPATFVNLVDLCTLDNTAYPCDGTKELDLGYNHLNVPAPEPPASFLAIKDPDWYLTQAVEKVIDGEIGGNLVSIDGTVKVEVPSDAVSGNITFLLEPQPSPSHDTGMLGFAGKSFRLTAWDSLGAPVTVFNMGKKITVRITYDEGDLGNIPEEALRLYYWDEIDSAWEDVITDCPVGSYLRIPEVNWLFAPVCHLSEFALLGENVYTTYMPLIFR